MLLGRIKRLRLSQGVAMAKGPDGLTLVGLCIVGASILWLVQPEWLMKQMYSASEHIGIDNVVIIPKPHDCEFLTAPLGSKHCHYEAVVDKVMWKTFTPTRTPMRSFDGGKTWDVVEHPGKCITDETEDCPELGDPTQAGQVPISAKVTAVMVNWHKVQE